jgi:hypothetical protein
MSALYLSYLSFESKQSQLFSSGADISNICRPVLITAVLVPKISIVTFSLDEVSGESHKLSCDLQLKETKVKALEER